MKKVLLILFGVVAAITLFVTGIFTLTSGAAGTADSFFFHLEAEATDEAWSLLSQEFQETTNKDDLRKTLASRGLTEVTDTTWNSRSITPGRAKVSGTATTRSGNTVPVTVDLVKNDDHWRIQYIGFDSPGISTKVRGTALTPPGEAEQIALVKESLTVFGESVNGKDFTPFVDHISDTWKNDGVTVEQLNQAFSSFIDQEINILPVLDSLAPAFDNEVVVADNGVMSITGVYPSTPSKLKFELDYIKEGTAWKVVRTALNIE